MLGGVAGVPNAKVVVLGAGVVGQNATHIAIGLGADVAVLDTDLDKLRQLHWRYETKVRPLLSSAMSVEREVLDADLVINTQQTSIDEAVEQLIGLLRERNRL